MSTGVCWVGKYIITHCSYFKANAVTNSTEISPYRREYLHLSGTKQLLPPNPEVGMDQEQSSKMVKKEFTSSTFIESSCKAMVGQMGGGSQYSMSASQLKVFSVKKF